MKMSLTQSSCIQHESLNFTNYTRPFSPMTVFVTMSFATPPTAVSNRPGARPQRSPPRNDDGEITCTHNDCQNDRLIFRRLCEYNKHMDKHERPYKCNNPACRKNPGFTYAGGLLRHQREVHNMHRTKDPFFCPHSSCNRSTGTGFSRRENLEEHLRRRHSAHSGSDVAESVVGEVVRQLEPLPVGRKRQIGTYIDGSGGREDDDDRGSDETDDRSKSRFVALQEENDRIKSELIRKDQALAELSQENRRLRNMLPPLPAHTVYRPPPPPPPR